MDSKEFRNYAVKHHRINNIYVDKYITNTQAYARPMALTPYIME